MLLYGAYWAFAIRRALIGRIYRNHALWLGVLCITGLIAAWNTLLPSSNNPFINALLWALDYAPWPTLVIFAFIDSTIPVLRRADPLLRSIFHWEKLRLGLWALAVFLTVLSIYLAVASNFSPTNQTSALVLNGLSLIIPVIPGAAALLIGARRSTDLVLRESVKWLGLALLFLLGIVLVGVTESMMNLSNYEMTYSYGAVPWITVGVVVGYALYRSARSVAPLNRLSRMEPEMIPSAKESTG